MAKKTEAPTTEETQAPIVVIATEEQADQIIAAKVDEPFTNQKVVVRTTTEHLAALVGGKITGVIVDTEEGDDLDRVYGLQVVVDHGVGFPTRKYNVWIQNDPEGNGPGFLAIEED